MTFKQISTRIGYDVKQALIDYFANQSEWTEDCTRGLVMDDLTADELRFIAKEMQEGRFTVDQ